MAQGSYDPFILTTWEVNTGLKKEECRCQALVTTIWIRKDFLFLYQLQFHQNILFQTSQDTPPSDFGSYYRQLLLFSSQPLKNKTAEV